jgi:hypothetical protein
MTGLYGFLGELVLVVPQGASDENLAGLEIFAGLRQDDGVVDHVEQDSRREATGFLEQ